MSAWVSFSRERERERRTFRLSISSRSWTLAIIPYCCWFGPFGFGGDESLGTTKRDFYEDLYQSVGARPFSSAAFASHNTRHDDFVSKK